MMEPIKSFSSRIVALPLENVDTDQIIPARYLKVTDKSGLGEGLFYAWRYNADGSPKPDFVLNRDDIRGAQILVAGHNFGCGSSREHAPWALHDYGFKAVIAPSFGDIFRNNLYQNGMLPVQLSDPEVRELIDRGKARPGCRITVDLEAQTVTLDDGWSAQFDVDPFRRDCLLKGLDDIGLTLQQEPAIAAFEARRPAWLPARR